MALSDQIKNLLAENGKDNKDLAHMLGLSLRQTQFRLQHSNFTREHLEIMSRELGLTTTIRSGETVLHEKQAEYFPDKPVRFVLEVNGKAAKEFPDFVEKLEELIKEYQDKTAQ